MTVDDVGCTVLWRAGPEDVVWFEKLLANNRESQTSTSATTTTTANGKQWRMGYLNHPTSAVLLGHPSIIALLLCRAISPHEDPPLGCAVLTLGFSI